MLLVEDDPGDAFLVAELLREEAAPVDIRRAQSLAEGLDLLRASPSTASCSTSGCPTPAGSTRSRACARRRRTSRILVLTGDRDDQRGIDAVAAGAQDYLVKGSVDGDGLRRAILYAVERRQADSVREQLRAAEILAEEATRLERGLLPVPILNDGALLVGTGYRPGRERTLLGGDFYDLVQTRDGAVHLMIGDVSGHGADEAALGVCLRVAWRTLTLGGVDVDAGAALLQECSSTSATPRRSSPRLDGGHHAGPHVGDRAQRRPPAAGAPRRAGRRRRRSARRRPARRSASSTTRLAARASWRCRRAGAAALTDGLIEGRAAGGSARLGMDGLIALLAASTPPRAGRGALDARRRPHRARSRAQRRSGARRRRRPAAHGRPERRLMRHSRLSAGAWLALSAGVLAVATLVAVGAALIASHHLTAGPQARGRPRRRRGQHGAGALQRDGQPGDRRARLRARRRGAVPGPLPRRRRRRARARRSSRRWRSEMGGRLTGDLTAARHAIAAWQSGYARADDRAHPPLRRRADRGRRGGGRQGAFDAVRASLARLQADLRADRADARGDSRARPRR